MAYTKSSGTNTEGSSEILSNLAVSPSTDTKSIVEFLFEIISKKKQIFIEAVSFGL